MRELPKPEFVKIDPAAVEADLIARYEAKSGKTLYPAQIERLFIDLIAYTRSRVDMSIQNAGEQLLVRFARGVILDYLGELVATPRLLAQPARCQIRFSLPTAGVHQCWNTGNHARRQADLHDRPGGVDCCRAAQGRGCRNLPDSRYAG